MRSTLMLTVLLFASQAAADDSWPARENRVAIVLNFDYGLVSMPGFDGYADKVSNSVEALGRTIEGYEAPSSALGAELGVRYYAPYYIAAYVGADALLDHAKNTIEGGDFVEHYNLILEVPILIGGHYPVHPHIHLHAVLGPTVLAIPGSYWDSQAGMPDFKGDTGVGMQARFGADFYAVDQVSFGFELMYRLAKAEVAEKNGHVVQVGGETVTGFELDFSGFGITVGFRLVI